MSGWAGVPPAESAVREAIGEYMNHLHEKAYREADFARIAIDTLRSLPVEQRMEAMGMKPCAICADGKHFMEAE